MRVAKYTKIFIICSLTMGMFGCSKELSTKDTEREKIVLEVYAWSDEEENIRILAEAYEKTHTDIRVHVNVIPGSEYIQQLTVLNQRGEQLDCILTSFPASALAMANKGLIQKIDEYGEAEDAFYPDWYGGEKKAKSYMLPYRMGQWVVYYNKTLFDQMGVAYPDEDWTWEEYAETAKNLTGVINGKKAYGSLSFEPDSIWWMTPARSAGAMNPLEESDLEEMKKAAKWCYDLTYVLGAQIPYTEQTGERASNYDALFLNGNIGMYFCGDWSVQSLNKKIREDRLKFDYDIAPLPHWEGKESYGFANAAVVTMSATTEHPDEVFSFMQFTAGEQGAKLLAKNSIIPAWQDNTVRQQYMESIEQPEHAEYLFEEKKICMIPADVSYNEAIDLVRDEVEKYLLKEQGLEETFAVIEQKLKPLK